MAQIDYEALKVLLQTNPNYDTETDENLAAWCNELAEQRTQPTINSDTMYELIDAAEWTALTADEQAEVWNMLLLFATSGIPTAAGTRARSRFVAIFGAGSTTINNVVAAITFSISRVAASDVGASEVSAGQVNHARSL